MDQFRIGERTRFEDHFEDRIVADFCTQRFDFVARQVVFAVEHLADADDDVDLIGAVFDGHRRFEHFHLQVGLRGRESPRHAGDRHFGIAGGQSDGLDENRIDADRRHAARLREMPGQLDRLAREFTDRASRIRSAQRGEVDTAEAPFVHFCPAVTPGLRPDLFEQRAHFVRRRGGTEIAKGRGVFHSSRNLCGWGREHSFFSGACAVACRRLVPEGSEYPCYKDSDFAR